MKFLRTMFFFFFVFSSIQALAQTPLQTTGPVASEKIFVHTDKDYYVAGEILWYKMYLLNQGIDRNLSRVAYIEIIGKDGKAALQVKTAVDQGNGNGSIVLPSSIPSGNYILRAYTRWMRNAGPEYFFHKQITIVNTLKKSEPVSGSEIKTIHLQLFPEGGDLVNDLQSRIAFLATDQYGRGVSGKGFVSSETGDTLASFATSKFGMGSFSFIPKAGKSYNASFVQENGQKVSVKLPSPIEWGYVMSADNAGDLLRISVAGNNQKFGQVGLTVVHHGANVYQQTKNTADGKAVFEIDRTKLPAGISAVTLYDADRKAVAERLVFKKPGQESQPVFELDEKNVGRRKPVNVKLKWLPDSADNLTHLSASVYRVDELQPDVLATDISSWYWLESELGNSIESPGFYLAGDSEKEADLLMLTKGWRRFKNAVNASATKTNFFPEYEGLIIPGKVVDRRTGRGIPNTAAYLTAPGQRFVFSNAVSNASGDLVFNAKNFYGGGEIIVQTNYQADSNYRVDILSAFDERQSGYTLSPFSINSSSAKLLQERSLGMQALNAYAQDELQHFSFPAFSDTGSFYGRADRRYALDDYTRFVTMEEVMREYVEEVRLSKQRTDYRYSVLNLPFKTYFENNPLILLDGVPVFNVKKMVEFDPLKVKELEVVTKKYYYGPQAFDGIVSYKTYEGDMGGYELDPNATIIEYPGLQLQREFYSPVYKTEKEINSRTPDFRNLLYWSPDITTDGFNFFSSDLPGKYLVVIQGIGPTGLPVSRISQFTVN